MPRIDKATIDKIHDAVNIVDVVGDFVSLKRRGSSWLGLCPFHNERTPSFSVSPSRGIFKCFSCGKAGTAVSFLMDLESMTYIDAIKWLGRKYGIEVKERELTGEERQAEAQRESMFAVNEFALGVFTSNLTDTDEGRTVGHAYFAERGISEAMIKKFHLGYALERRDDLLEKARAAGFDDKFLVATGLEIETERGLYDRFKGRVIYPVHSLSGRVVAFGGRTLRKEKTIAKYVNSPESDIYSKSNELYGLYQARQAISRKKHCIIVEGYMDVISMHQAGVENVVASSGTSLTDGQIRLVRRFADTVTLIYDSDAAGIKASLRGIDMLVAAGFDLKIVLLPEGDDPDSFAQNHSSHQVEQYIEQNSRNLIDFKAEVLLGEAGTDPRARTEAINSILQTISLIPDPVEQTFYMEEFVKKSGVPATTLGAQLKRLIAGNIEKQYKKRQLDKAAESIDKWPLDNDDSARQTPETNTNAITADASGETSPDNIKNNSAVYRAEEEIVRHLLRRGLFYLCDGRMPGIDEPVPMSVIDIIDYELRSDNVEIRDPLLKLIYDQAIAIRDSEEYASERAQHEQMLDQRKQTDFQAGLEQIRNSANDHLEIEKLEKALNDRLNSEFNQAYDSFTESYIRKRLLRSSDRRITDMVARLTSDPVVLSKMYSMPDIRDQLIKQLPVAINTLKSMLLKEEMSELLQKIAEPHSPEEFAELQRLYMEKKERCMLFDKNNGEIVITPPAR